MTARIYHSPCSEVLAGQDVRSAAVTYLRERLYDVAHDWKKEVYASSISMTSPCGRKILKIDNTKLFTMDTKTTEGWKSAKFTCKTIEEAWSLLVQSVKAFDARRK